MLDVISFLQICEEYIDTSLCECAQPLESKECGLNV